MANAWTKTRGVLKELGNLLQCSYCHKEVKKPCMLGSCEHFFCRVCVEQHVHNQCTVCGVPSHVKDIQSNRQLSSAVALCKRLDQLLIADQPPSQDETKIPMDEQQTPTLEPACEASTSVKSPNEEKEGGTEFPCTPVPPDLLNPPNIAGRTRKGRKQTTREKKVVARKKKVVASNDHWGVGHKGLLSQCNSCQKGKGKGRPNPKSVRFPSETDPPLFEDVPCDGPKEIEKNYAKKGKKKNLKKTEEKISQEEKKEEIEKKGKVEKMGVVSAEETKIENVEGVRAEKTKKKRGRKPRISPEEKVEKEKKKDPSDQPWLTPDEDVSPNLQNKVPRKRRSAEPMTPVRSKVITARSPALNSSITSSVTSSPAVSKRNAKGETPLHVAVIKGDVDRVMNLLSEGAVVNTKDNAGWTPLHEACNHGNTEVAALLLENGAVINTPGLDHDTPLHDAVNNNRLDCAKMLVSHGALLTSRNIHGKTPFDLARTAAMKKVLTRTETDPELASKTQTVLSQSLTDTDVVVVATGLSRDEKNKLQKCVQMMHGQFDEEYSNRVTHIVTSVNKDGMCPRTMKFLKGILGGRWIVNFDWISTCEEYKERVSEEPFQVPGSSSSPFSYSPERARVNSTLQLPGLFSGMNFYLAGSYEYPTPTKDDMYSLIKMADGIVLSREPKPELIETEAVVAPYHSKKVESQSAKCNHFVVLDNNASTLMINERICHVPASYLMDCIAYFELVDLPL